MGGKRPNMSKAIAEAGAGRGTVGKPPWPVRRTGPPIKSRRRWCRPQPSPSCMHARAPMLADAATVYTDGASVYDNLPNSHEAVNHSLMEFVRGNAPRRGILPVHAEAGAQGHPS